MKSCEINEAGMIGGCYDKIFSGHFSIVFLITLLLWKHKYISLIPLFFINLVNGILIIMTRAHYSIDVVVAIFVTLFVYQNNISILRYIKV